MTDPLNITLIYLSIFIASYLLTAIYVRGAIRLSRVQTALNTILLVGLVVSYVTGILGIAVLEIQSLNDSAPDYQRAFCILVSSFAVLLHFVLNRELWREYFRVVVRKLR